MSNTRFDAQVAIQGNESLPHAELHMVLPTGNYDSAWTFAKLAASYLKDFGTPSVMSVTKCGPASKPLVVGQGTGLPGPSLPDQVTTGDYTWSRKSNPPEEELDQGARNLLRASQDPPCPQGFYGCDHTTAHAHTGPQETSCMWGVRGCPDRAAHVHTGKQETAVSTDQSMTTEKLVESLGLADQAWLARRCAKTGHSVEFVLRELIEAGIQKTEDQHQAAREQLAAFPGRKSGG